MPFCKIQRVVPQAIHNHSLFTAPAALIQSGDFTHATPLLRQAQAYRAVRAEALLWQAIQALKQQQPQTAWLCLCGLQILAPHTPDLARLLAKAARQQGADLVADRVIMQALDHDPLNPDLRIAAWPIRARHSSPTELMQAIHAHLPRVGDAKELKAMLALLPLSPLGVVRIEDATQGIISGWVLDRCWPNNRPSIHLRHNGQTLQIEPQRPHPLLLAAGLSDQGGFRLHITPSPQPIDLSLADGTPLVGSPLLLLKPLPPPSITTPLSKTVDVIVPVYRGYPQTLECLHSLIQARSNNHTPYHVIVLNDASPEPELVEALEALAAAGHIQLIHHIANLGFVRGMNRAMVLHPDRDIVWLNADTRVCHDWLDRLHNAAYSATDIASVSPLSNHGELMSFPEPARRYPMPDAVRQAQLDRLAQQSWNGEYPEINVGCGFCLYLRRDVLAQVGYLDEHHLGQGYGEDTDWCLRAHALGLRHLGAPHLFVAHQGSVSFGAEKRGYVAHNNALLRRRYPHAERGYERHLACDPVKPHRQRLLAAMMALDLAPQEAMTALKPSDPLPAAGAINEISRTPRVDGHPITALLIGDDLDHATVGERWLAVARHWARDGQKGRLIMTQNNAWAQVLQTTGVVYPVQTPAGVALRDTLKLCGCGALVSLNTQPDEHWNLPALARELDLPLLAPDSRLAQQAGASPLPIAILKVMELL